MANTIIEARGLTRRFGAVLAVRGVDLDIARGELFGLIGHNGAGKSTLFKMMLGLIAPSAGDIHIDGCPAHGSRFREVRRRIGYLPENVVLYDNLTGLETLRFFARLKRAPVADCEHALARVGLAQAGRRRVREYSKGMRQRLGLAQALLGSPTLLFLDEPTTGLDPEAIRNFYAILAQLKQGGVTIVLTSHILAEIQQRVDRLAIMDEGRIRALGSVAELRRDVDLPLLFELVPTAGAAARVLQALAGLAVQDLTQRADSLSFKCARAQKMRVIEVLAAQDGALADVHVHEPTLEDVFFGYRN